MVDVVFSGNTVGAYIGDYAGMQDCQIFSNDPTTNYDGVGLESSKYGLGDTRHFLSRAAEISLLPGSLTVSSASYHLYLLYHPGGGADHTQNFRKVLRPWSEVAVTWNTIDGVIGWTTPGALDVGTDISSTITGSMISPAIVGWQSFSSAQLAADIEGMADGTFANNGWHTERDGVGQDATYRVYEESSGTDGQRPALLVTYTENGATAPLTGATVSISTANGTVTTSVPVAGNTASISTAGGAMSATMSFAGSTISEAITTAALAAGMEMTGAIIQEAINTGNLTIGMSMDGNTIAEAVSSGTFATDESGNLSGSLSSSSSADAAVTANVPMTGATLSSSSASSNLASIQPLTGGTVSVTKVVGALNISMGLAANTSAESFTDGTVTFRVQMDGKTISEAASAGMFALGGDYRLPPLIRLVRTGIDNRLIETSRDCRVIAA